MLWRIRQPDQDKEVGEAFYWQLKVASKSQTLVLVSEFNYTDISRRSNRVKHKQCIQEVPGKQC